MDITLMFHFCFLRPERPVIFSSLLFPTMVFQSLATGSIHYYFKLNMTMKVIILKFPWQDFSHVICHCLLLRAKLGDQPKATQLATTLKAELALTVSWFLVSCLNHYKNK